MYLEKSMTTATLQHCPERLVPPPRERTGAPSSRQAATVATTSASSRGRTRPIGTWRELEAAVADKARDAWSKRTSPRTTWRSFSSSTREAENFSCACGSRLACCRIGKAVGAAMVKEDVTKMQQLLCN